MADLLAATGWIGEHPDTGADVAHLLLYPATDLDPGAPAKIQALADALGFIRLDAPARPPRTKLTVDWRHEQLQLGDEVLIERLPHLTPDWITSARIQRLAVISLTGAPLSAPGIAEVDALIEGSPEAVWMGLARVGR